MIFYLIFTETLFNILENWKYAKSAKDQEGGSKKIELYRV
jgi:hypothetical protein